MTKDHQVTIWGAILFHCRSCVLFMAISLQQANRADHPAAIYADALQLMPPPFI